MASFQDFKLPALLAKALQAMAYEIPTPVQIQAIPAALSRRDLIACAQVGSGKTAAFCIPILMRLLHAPGKTALILVPTRKLANQIEEVWKNLSLFAPLMTCTSLVDGKGIQSEVRALERDPRAIIATPGRLIEHLNQGTISVSRTEILVLDEADHMLDLGFAQQLSQILRFLPKTRQTLLFSATLPAGIDQLSGKYLKDPVRITIEAVRPAAKKSPKNAASTAHRIGRTARAGTDGQARQTTRLQKRGA